MKFGITSAMAVAIAAFLGPLQARAQVEGNAADLIKPSEAGGIEVSSPLLQNYEQQRQDNFEQLNLRYQRTFDASEQSIFGEDLDQLLDSINVNSVSDDTARPRQSIGIDLTEF